MKARPYPNIMSEDDTIDACSTRSIARFGDGEWRVAVDGGCTSQRPDPRLASELRSMLQVPGDCLVGIPNPFNGCPRQESWLRYTLATYTALLGAKTYASSFITRPDNAPWIDRPDYWEKVRNLWRGQDVVLVAGDKKSLTSEVLGLEAKSFRQVTGPRQHAYAEIDRIEEEIGQTSARVLLCLGATATALAYRLSRKGMHALDLGHIGMFMRHAGSYAYQAHDLFTEGYREQLSVLHRSRTWGADGAKHADVVRALIDQYKPATILDYGCGEMELAKALSPIRVSGYDPGIPGREKMPKPCDLVVCTDVLEHIEPEKLNNVLDHIFRLTSQAAYFVIACKPAKTLLPDGRNAHLIVESADWWMRKLHVAGFTFERFETSGKDVSLVAEKS